jgi:tetratricopeptide (TPR) repeat protein
MSALATDADLLRGKQVAFTGRLASLTRREAAALVHAHGGKLTPTVSRRTSFLIVGQEGWPLRQDGRPTAKLRQAHLLQRRGCAIQVLPEEEFLSRLGLDARSDEIRRLHSTAELTRLLQIPRDRLRAWLEAGLVQAVEINHGIAYFDFRQVAGAKTLCELVRAGVTVTRLRGSLEQLRAWAGDLTQPLAQLALLEKDGDLLVRVGQALAEPSGQLRLDFSDGNQDLAVAFAQRRPTADEWFELACQHEDAGRLAEAEQAYRRALLEGGPDPVSSFNLGNVLYALGRKAEAAERFHQALELNPEDGECWNNFGTVLAELKRTVEANDAFKRAIQLGYADAHYSLADLLDQAGETIRATSHWQAYLQRDQQSAWAHYARRRLGKMS